LHTHQAHLQTDAWPAQASASPLTVLHIFSGDLWAGAEVMIFHLLTRLQSHPGLRIIALSLNEGRLTEQLRAAGVRTHVIAEEKHPFLRILVGAWRLLKGEKISVIHAHRYKENLLALLLSWPLGVRRRVTTLHGMPEPFTGAQAAKATGVAHVNEGILRWFFHSVAVSHAMRKTWVERHRFQEARVAVIHNGVDMPAAKEDGRDSKYAMPAGMLHVGTVGRFVPVKGYDLFLEIAAEIGKRMENVRFSILGEGPLKADLARRLESLGLQGRVFFFAHTPSPHLLSIA